MLRAVVVAVAITPCAVVDGVEVVAAAAANDDDDDDDAISATAVVVDYCHRYDRCHGEKRLFIYLPVRTKCVWTPLPSP